MRIHLISDTHIENHRGLPLTPFVPMVSGGVCVLAGDIGTAKRSSQYREYLLKVKDQFEHVILVLGNHEFYQMRYESVLETMLDVADRAGVILMDIELGTENITIDGVTFFGSTLWIDFNKNNPLARNMVGKCLNDFHVIYNFNTTKAYEIHQRTVEKINWNADVVISHHMPIVRPHSKFEHSDVSYGFYCTDLEEKIMDSKIKYWLYGHTHDNAHYEVGETQIISNQMGYNLERMTKSYDPNFSIEL